MELGAFGADIGMFGYYNRATLAYFFYLTIFYLFYRITKSKNLLHKKTFSLSFEVNPLNSFIIKFNVSLVILIFFLFLMLFVFGGINVLLGDIQKGEFRLNIGFFGFFAFLITKLFAPAILAYLTILFKKYGKYSKILRTKYYLAVIIVILIGASWGFKSTAITLLIPALIIYYDRIKLKKLIKITFLGIILFSFFAFLFDGKELKLISSSFLELDNTNQFKNFSALEFIFYRLTVVQGNSAWKVWDLYISGHEMPNYWLTLTSIFGDKFLSFAGISHYNMEMFIKTHYSYLVTNLVTGSNYFLTFEHNVTSTAFSEGLILGGIAGVALIAAFLGVLTGIINNKLVIYYNNNLDIKLSLLSVFFVSYFRAWMNSGGIVTVLHISVFIGLFLTYILLKFISKAVIK